MKRIANIRNTCTIRVKFKETSISNGTTKKKTTTKTGKIKSKSAFNGEEQDLFKDSSLYTSISTTKKKWKSEKSIATIKRKISLLNHHTKDFKKTSKNHKSTPTKRQAFNMAGDRN